MKFTKEFTDAVEQKNRLRVRIMLKDAFLLDKTGDTFDKMEQYAAERVPELYEAHDEETLLNQPEQWTANYFNEQMTKLVGNFSRERVALLEKKRKLLHRQNGRKRPHRSGASCPAVFGRQLVWYLW